MNCFLFRNEKKSTHTVGYLVVMGQMFRTIERPWKNNARNISCIPAGTYPCHYLPRSASGKYRKVYHVRNVANRSGVLIHNGNLVSHSRGCIILGMKTGNLGGKRAVLSSRTAMRKLNQLLDGANFNLKVV